MMDWGNGNMGAGWGIVMVLSMLAFWALIALAVVWFVRSSKAPTTTPTGGAIGSAEQILAERLARGEIDPEEYQARLAALKLSR